MAGINTPDDITFQPTLPARGATTFERAYSRALSDFNPRSPHGERRQLERDMRTKPAISTHAPRTGSDTARRIKLTW